MDIETTGGMTKRDKITEIAIVIFDGEKIIDSFESLVNPGRSIPHEITRITGITDQMVADAPKFYQIAKRVVEILEDTIFVAHNVRFDYNFIREEFESLGYAFHKKKLCTVVLSRKAFPGLKSYSLGNLIKHFGIQVQNRHRAMDDVMATLDIFSKILSNEAISIHPNSYINSIIQATHIPKNFSKERIDALPEAVGVYYFYNIYGTIIYVGKSINIKKRVMQHFGGLDGKTDKFIAKVADIQYTLTGSELMALLLESSEIKRLHPEINKAQRSRDYPYHVHTYINKSDYICFDVAKPSAVEKSKISTLNHYASKSGARGHLYSVLIQHELCACLNGLHNQEGSCFYHQMGKCSGAAMQLESTISYNERAMNAMHDLKKTFEYDFFIVLPGRYDDEVGIVLIENGHSQGYGFISQSLVTNYSAEEWKAAIESCPPTPETNRIIRSWLDKYPETTIKKL